MTDIGRALEILMQEANDGDVPAAAQRLQQLAKDHGVRIEAEATRIVQMDERSRGEPRAEP